MYKFGELKDLKMANQICQDLSSKGISADISPNQEGGVDLFVHDELHVPYAFDYFRVKMGIAKPIEIDNEWLEIKKAPLGQITKVLILISCFVTILYYIPSTKKIYSFLMIATPKNNQSLGFLSEVLAGEVWRIITPIFLHFNFIHIFFNMMWTKDLGSIIEEEKGAKKFLWLIALTAIIPNILQYSVMFYSIAPEVAGRFGGMSGVVFGLLGFIWMNKTFDSNAKYSLPKRDVGFMVAWYFLCITGIFGPIANIAHGAGLGLGMLMGVFTNNFQSAKTTEVLKYSFYALFFVIGTIAIEIVKFKFIFN